jgi:hypothetical protein
VPLGVGVRFCARAGARTVFGGGRAAKWFFLAPGAVPGAAVPGGRVVLPGAAVRAFLILTLTLIFQGRQEGVQGNLEPGGAFPGSGGLRVATAVLPFAFDLILILGGGVSWRCS